MVSDWAMMLTNTTALPLRGLVPVPVILRIDIAVIVIDLPAVRTVATAKRDVIGNVGTPISTVMTTTTEVKWATAPIREKTHPKNRLGDLRIRVTEITPRRKTLVVVAIGHIGHIGKGVGSGTEVSMGVEDVQDQLRIELAGQTGWKRASI